MQKINSYEELREFCLGKAKEFNERIEDSCRFISVEPFVDSFELLYWPSKPKYLNDLDTWSLCQTFNEDSKLLTWSRGDDMCVEITFNCDFSKCMWEIK